MQFAMTFEASPGPAPDRLHLTLQIVDGMLLATGEEAFSGDRRLFAATNDHLIFDAAASGEPKNSR